MATVAETWDRIHAWLGLNAAQILAELNPGASEEKIKELENKLEVNDLPDDFKESYRIHDGSSAGCFFGTRYNCHTFHTIDEIVEDWSVNKDVLDKEDFGPYDRKEDDPLEFLCHWWNPRWIPFGNNGCGDSISMDLAPTEAGTYGQVFQWYHDGGKFELLAKNFSELLNKFADDLENDKYRVADDGSNSLIFKEYDNI